MNKWLARSLAIVLTLGWATGCSRQIAASGSSNGAQLPFDRVSDNAGLSPTAAFTSDGIPSGTEIVIRLQLVLSSADARPGSSFAAVLDQPVIIANKTILPEGAPVTGTVLAAAPASQLNDPGYLRLTLTSIAVNGNPLVLQTSSIFAKGWSYEKPNASRSTEGNASPVEREANSEPEDQTSPPPSDANVRFSTGHRFTFRLIQPLRLRG
jgi:hypothetical protein